jgi:hypothetical protein
MKKIIGIIIILIGFQSCAQKDLSKKYQIEKTVWKYETPKEFKVKVDNFKEVIEVGNKYLEKDTVNNVTYDDVILLSLAKTLEKDMNMLMVSYKPNNDNIARFTLKGYAEKMKEFFENGPNKNDSNIIEKVIIEELKIDNVLFYNVKKNSEYLKEKYSYTSEFIVTEIDNREFGFVIVTDNAEDRKKLMNSIIKSEFE